ncbi:MAG: PAS domain-containing protein [candidate division Zixibacteria bacterium]|jgi:PAS domain S-box-containing protein|nr:PAS domain-containing protein [candidate division Zixibacteria bacterium]
MSDDSRKSTKVSFSESAVESGCGDVSTVGGRGPGRRALQLRRSAPEESLEIAAASAEESVDWHMWVGADGKARWMNRAVERITGYTVSECLSTPEFPIPVIHEEDRFRVSPAFTPESGLPSGHDREFRIRRKDGTIAWGAVSWQMICDQSGRTLGICTSIRDITERKRAEEVLQGTKARLDVLLASSPAVIYTCGPPPAYPTTFISDNINGRFGYRPDDFYKDEMFWNKRVHPEDLEHVRTQLERIQRGESVSYEYRFQHRNGAYIWLRDDMTPLHDDDGRVVGLIGSWFDITERKWAEAMLQRAHDELEHRVRERTVQLADANQELLVERENLQKKNLALKEILSQFETGKREIAEQIQSNIYQIAIPLIDHLHGQTMPGAEHYLTLLKSSLVDIISPFVGRLEEHSTRLTPRELEICNMIKNGLTSKEIAAALHNSIETVFKQRKIIRKKLGIANRKRNLTSYLRSLERKGVTR